MIYLYISKSLTTTYINQQTPIGNARKVMSRSNVLLSTKSDETTGIRFTCRWKFIRFNFTCFVPKEVHRHLWFSFGKELMKSVLYLHFCFLFKLNVMPRNGHYKTSTHKQIGKVPLLDSQLLVFYLIEPFRLFLST